LSRGRERKRAWNINENERGGGGIRRKKVRSGLVKLYFNGGFTNLKRGGFPRQIPHAGLS